VRVVDAIADFSRFFRNHDEEARAASFERKRLALEWASQPYHKFFLEWLEDESNKPLPVSESHMEMVKAACRANAFREVREHILRSVREAEAGIQAAREGSDV
jgi:hypothetical protein